MAASRKKPDLLEVLVQQWPELSGHCCFELALSGGLDSMVLLDLLVRLRERYGVELRALHVHHGLSPNADRWQAHCLEYCERLQVPLRVVKLSLQRRGGESLEALARQGRYAALRESTAQVLVLAQHQDDQVETVLLQAVRGGGVYALAGMPRLDWRAPHHWWRPLLPVSRRQLQEYAEWRGLTWVEDESNADPKYRRNWLRHHWLPELEHVQPDYRAQVVRTAGLMADAAQVLDELVVEDLARFRRGGALLLDGWRDCSPARQRMLLRSWLLACGIDLPPALQLEAMQLQLQSRGGATHPHWSLGEFDVYAYRDELHAIRRVSTVPIESVCAPPWLESGQGGISWVHRQGDGLSQASLVAGYSLASWVGGERLAIANGTTPVKELMRVAGIPPVLRKCWPLVYAPDGKLLAVPGLRVAHDVRAALDEWGWWPEFGSATE